MVASGFAITGRPSRCDEAYGALPSMADNWRASWPPAARSPSATTTPAFPRTASTTSNPRMPMHEITRMREAGMTPMQIVVAADVETAARARPREEHLGTLAAGRTRGRPGVDGDPLADLLRADPGFGRARARRADDPRRFLMISPSWLSVAPAAVAPRAARRSERPWHARVPGGPARKQGKGDQACYSAGSRSPTRSSPRSRRTRPPG